MHTDVRTEGTGAESRRPADVNLIYEFISDWHIFLKGLGVNGSVYFFESLFYKYDFFPKIKASNVFIYQYKKQVKGRIVVSFKYGIKQYLIFVLPMVLLLVSLEFLKILELILVMSFKNYFTFYPKTRNHVQLQFELRKYTQENCS